MNIDFNELSKAIYEQNKAIGWWDDPDRCKLTLLQLVSTEIAEATEGERKNLMDDHLPHRKMGEVELADALIRILDMGGAYGWVYSKGSMKDGHEAEMHGKDIGAMHHYLNCAVCLIGGDLEVLGGPHDSYSLLIESIQYVAKSQGYDVEGAMIEKLEYNKKRADHKRENRAKENGKKF